MRSARASIGYESPLPRSEPSTRQPAEVVPPIRPRVTGYRDGSAVRKTWMGTIVTRSYIGGTSPSLPTPIRVAVSVSSGLCTAVTMT
jgi:hypothetical protein